MSNHDRDQGHRRGRYSESTYHIITSQQGASVLRTSTQLQKSRCTCNRRERKCNDDRPLEFHFRGNQGSGKCNDNLNERERDVEKDCVELAEAEAL